MNRQAPPDPACMCLAYTHRGSVARIGESCQAIYRDWLLCSERHPVLPFNFERYPAAGADPYADDYILEICVPVREGSGVTPALPAEARA